MNKFNSIGENLYVLKIDFAGIYVAVYLSLGKQNILVDSGLKASDVDDFIVPALKEMNLSLKDVDAFMCTHTHGDHIGGLARIKELNPSIKVVATDLQKDKINHPLEYNIEIRKAFPEDSPPPSYGLRGVEVDEIVKENDVVGNLKVIYTPGHDNDCISLLDINSGCLLTGDSIQQNGTNTQGMALYMYLPMYEETIKELLSMPIKSIVFGHPFNPHNDDVVGEDNVQRFLEQELVLIDEYAKIVKENIHLPMKQIANLIINNYNGIHPDKMFLALFTVKEHIKKQGE